MEEKIIDCTRIHSREDLHAIFREALAFPEWYGDNLDALYDCLTEISETTRLHLVNWADAESRLGPYARAAKRAILEAATQNSNLAVLFD